MSVHSWQCSKCAAGWGPAANLPSYCPECGAAGSVVAQASDEKSTFWLSFCDGNRPTGTQFLGIVLVDADTLHEAVSLSHLHGVNPGGEIASMEVTPATKRDGPQDQIAILRILPRLTLLSREQIEAAGTPCATVSEIEAEAQ